MYKISKKKKKLYLLQVLKNMERLLASTLTPFPFPSIQIIMNKKVFSFIWELQYYI